MMMNGKGLGRKRSWPNLRYYAGIRLDKLNKPQKTTISIAGRRGRDQNPEPPEYEAGVLTTRPRRSPPPPLVVLNGSDVLLLHREF
jgi:hypothetical protein